MFLAVAALFAVLLVFAAVAALFALAVKAKEMLLDVTARVSCT